jgi:hypothetical protein
LNQTSFVLLIHESVFWALEQADLVLEVGPVGQGTPPDADVLVQVVPLNTVDAVVLVVTLFTRWGTLLAHEASAAVVISRTVPYALTFEEVGGYALGAGVVGRARKAPLLALQALVIISWS